MKVKVFMNTAGHNSEREVLRAMHDGIHSILIPSDKDEYKALKKFNKANNLSLSVSYDYGDTVSNCDLAVMLGSWKPDRSNKHHVLRTSIVESGIPFICIETPLLARKVFQPNEYYRVGVNGFLNRDAYFGPEENFNDTRFRSLGYLYNGWAKSRGNKIVIAMQLAGDASLRNNDINEWCWDTVRTLRKITDRPIEIRTHPGVSEKGWGNHEELFKKFAFEGMPNIKFVNGRDVPWEEHIVDAYCVVSYTSGLSIDAIISGVPVIACDEGNFAWNISETKLKNIENLHIPTEDTVKQWLYNLAWCQWTVEEMESGVCFKHLRSHIEGLVKQRAQDNESN